MAHPIGKKKIKQFAEKFRNRKTLLMKSFAVALNDSITRSIKSKQIENSNVAAWDRAQVLIKASLEHNDNQGAYLKTLVAGDKAQAIASKAVPELEKPVVELESESGEPASIVVSYDLALAIKGQEIVIPSSLSFYTRKTPDKLESWLARRVETMMKSIFGCDGEWTALAENVKVEKR